MHVDQVHIDFLSQSFILNFVNEPFLKHFLQTVFFVFENNSGSSSGVDCSDDIGEVAFQLVNVGDGFVNIFFDLSNNFSELLIVDGEIVFEHSDCLLASLCENDCDLVDEVYF